MGLYFDEIFDKNNTSRVPSKVIISGPVANSGTFNLCGLLTSEFSLSSQNKWGGLLPTLTELSTVSQLLGSKDILAWIGASVQVWKGTDPLRFNLDILLLNYKAGLNIENDLKSLSKLTALSPPSGGVWSQMTSAQVHGGYAPSLMTPNNGYYANDDIYAGQNDGNNNGPLKSMMSKFNELGAEIASMTDDTQGTVTVYVGNKIKISNLLVSRVDVTPSLIEVIDKKPLYYKVLVGFTGYRPLLSTDIDNMY